jgi:hypothetical protein
MILFIYIVLLFKTNTFRMLSIQRLSANCVQCAILLLTSTLMYAVAMGNISLAVLTCFIISPVFSIAKPVSQRFAFVCIKFFKTLIAIFSLVLGS